MPELPEVEYARQSLEKWLSHGRIEKVHVYDARILDVGARPSHISKALEGARVSAVERRGKWLRIVTDRARVFSHLGMTGDWEVAKPKDEPLRFEKVRLDVLASKARRSVRYTDPRLFGRFVVIEGDKPDLRSWSALGPDPLVDGIDVDELHAKLARRKLAIKPALLDQKVIAGVGNIHATEALFAARVDPRRPAREISRAEVSAIARGIHRSITKALARQEHTQEREQERRGGESPFTIYGNEGTRCPRCKEPLSKMILGGRGTVFCVHCQR